MPSALTRSDIVLSRFPFTDLTGSARRPAVVVSWQPIGEDIVLIAVSSVLREAATTDILIETNHPECAATGLAKPSVIRVHKLVAVTRFTIDRRLGHLGSQLMGEVDQKLRTLLGL